MNAPTTSKTQDMLHHALAGGRIAVDADDVAPGLLGNDSLDQLGQLLR
jgi:hypothetical protein